MNLIGDLRIIDSLADSVAAPELYGAARVATTVIDGVLYGFVAAAHDDGIQIVRLDGDELVPIGSVSHSSFINLNRPISLEVVGVGSERFLVVASEYGHALTSFRIETADAETLGNLVHVQSLADNGALGSPTTLTSVNSIETVRISGNTYVLATSGVDDALSVFRLAADGTLSFVSSILDGANADFNLDGAASVEVVSVGSRIFVYVGTDYFDDGLSVFELTAAGQLAPVQNIEPGGNASIHSLCSIRDGNTNYLIAADTYTDRLIAYSIARDGTLTETDQFALSSSTDTYELQPLVVDGVPFIIASRYGLDSIGVYSLQGGELELATEISSPVELDGAYGLTLVEENGRLLLLATSVAGSRVVLLEIGGDDDALVGTAANDRMVGLGGDDDLFTGAGNDAAYGGAGDDIISGRTGNDTMSGGEGEDVLIGGIGNDVAEGGAGADVMLGGVGRDKLDYAASNAAVQIDLAAQTAAGGHAAGDLFRDFENVTGSAFNDLLTGSAVANALVGGGGRDTLVGAGGNDNLRGDAGDDSLVGGAGKDQMAGGAGRDRLFGDSGDDTLAGGADNDVLDGGVGIDSILGDDGNDTITGGAGDDRLNGGTGSDTFVFAAGHGDDRITGFSIAQDVVDLSAFANFNSLADVRAAAFDFSGNVVIQTEAGSSIRLFGLSENDFTDANFIF